LGSLLAIDCGLFPWRCATILAFLFIVERSVG
jgi:hypothetical protein